MPDEDRRSARAGTHSARAGTHPASDQTPATTPSRNPCARIFESGEFVSAVTVQGRRLISTCLFLNRDTIAARFLRGREHSVFEGAVYESLPGK